MIQHNGGEAASTTRQQLEHGVNCRQKKRLQGGVEPLVCEICFGSNIAIYLPPWPPKRTSKPPEKRSARNREHPALQNLKFLNFFLFLWVIFALLDLGPHPHYICIPNPDPDSDPADQNQCGKVVKKRQGVPSAIFLMKKAKNMI